MFALSLSSVYFQDFLHILCTLLTAFVPFFWKVLHLNNLVDIQFAFWTWLGIMDFIVCTCCLFWNCAACWQFEFVQFVSLSLCSLVHFHILQAYFYPSLWTKSNSCDLQRGWTTDSSQLLLMMNFELTNNFFELYREHWVLPVLSFQVQWIERKRADTVNLRVHH